MRATSSATKPRRSLGIRRTIRPLAAIAFTASATTLVAVHGAGCQQSPITVPVRSLEQSGRASFLCLGPPGAAGTMEHPLSDCTVQQFTDINEYYYADDAGDIDAGSGALPHLYALVTQTKRGEVAVIDLSSTQRNVLDVNPVEPGANFLPVGAEPTAIVSTPGGVASFVTVAEIGRAGIFALPSAKVRPASSSPGAGGYGGALTFTPSFDPGVQQLSSWPACALPSAPGDMIMVADPPTANGFERRSCDDAPSLPFVDDLVSGERNGRQKLVVAMPDLGGIIVVDAQALLNQPPGSFDPCPVERWLPLEVDLTGVGAAPTPPAPPAGLACTYPTQPQPSLKPPYTPRPAGLTYADGTLYVADQGAPIIHVIDMPTPCEPVERAPLVPSSIDAPQRVVTTGRISVAPAPTPELKRYLYATDIDDASIMVFDVGPTSTTRRPLSRVHPEWNPFVPRDRIRFSAPAADILVLQRDQPATNPVTGLAPAGVRCDPDPTKAVCTSTSTSCEIGTTYQTDRSSYTAGAGPAKLRGTFAFAALTSGRVAIIDVDDFDAPCRGPVFQSKLEGCADDVPGTLGRNTSWEESCNIVQPNTVRAASYEVVSDTVGNHVPGITSFPLLYDALGVIVDYAADGLSMVPPVPPAGTLPFYPASTVPVGYVLYVGGLPVSLNGAVGDAGTGTAGQHALAMNLEDPRAQVVDQNWVATFEGAIPGFVDRLADLRTDPAKGPEGLYDASSRFCDSGVLSEKAVRAMYEGAQALQIPNVDDAPVPAGCFEKVGDGPQKAAYQAAVVDNLWARQGDYVQIAAELPDQQAAYWKRLSDNKPGDDLAASCQKLDGTAISYTDCFGTYGTTETPTVHRDLRIVEAYQDHVELTARPDLFQPPVDPKTGKFTCDFPPAPPTLDQMQVKCCFPDALAFNVRVGTQWAVLGDQTGFLHHVVADPSSGVCRNSCEASAARKNARVIESPPDATPKDGDPLLFVNPMFRFAIRSGKVPTVTVPDRDKVFRWTTTGSFSALLVNLSADGTSLIQPRGLAHLPPTDELAVTDGSLNGLIFVSLSSVTLQRSFY